MPAQGDQHKPNGASTANPFEDTKTQQISAYTAQEIATLQTRLNRRLGPEYISTRAGPGNKKVAYLSAEKAINLANEVFGFNGWSSSIQNIQIDFVDESQSGKVSIGLSVVVRVTLRDGTYHEDIGYGGIENCKGKIAAFEKAKKEGTTDALKRALRSFGNVLGNCIYDHDYIAKVSKVKADPCRWDVNELHRHPDFAPKKEEMPAKVGGLGLAVPSVPSMAVEESFDAADFDDNDFEDFGNPDEMLLPTDFHSRQSSSLAAPATISVTPSKPPQMLPPQAHNAAIAVSSNRQTLPTTSNVQASRTLGTADRALSPGVVSQHFAGPTPGPAAPSTDGFLSAKSLDSTTSSIKPNATKFNPHAESPSIRKTTGVDHTKSIPLNRHTLKPEKMPSRDESDSGSDSLRRPAPLGSAVASPVSRPPNGSAYRPPTRHGPQSTGVPNIPNSGVDRIGVSSKRAPLENLSNVQQNPVNTDGTDTKRQRLDAPILGNPGEIAKENMTSNT